LKYGGRALSWDIHCRLAGYKEQVAFAFSLAAQGGYTMGVMLVVVMGCVRWEGLSWVLD